MTEHKGKYKDSNRSKGKDGHSETSNNEPICVRYNKLQKCDGKMCRCVYVCGLCLGTHPACECRGAARGADTQGGGLNH